VTSNRPSLFNFTPGERRDYEAATLRYTAAAHVNNYLDHVGLQAKDLAHRIRKSRAWVSKLLSGRQNATLDTLAEVGWALGAKWKIDLVSAERTGTPAENDPPAPRWATGPVETTNVSTSSTSAPAWRWAYGRFSPYGIDAELMNAFNILFSEAVDVRPTSGQRYTVTGIQDVQPNMVASATASLQVSMVTQ